MTKYTIIGMAYERSMSEGRDVSTQDIINDLHQQGAHARRVGTKCPYPGSSDAGKAWKRGHSNVGFGERL